MLEQQVPNTLMPLVLHEKQTRQAQEYSGASSFLCILHHKIPCFSQLLSRVQIDLNIAMDNHLERIFEKKTNILPSATF